MLEDYTSPEQNKKKTNKYGESSDGDSSNTETEDSDI